MFDVAVFFARGVLRLESVWVKLQWTNDVDVWSKTSVSPQTTSRLRKLLSILAFVAFRGVFMSLRLVETSEVFSVN